MTLTVPSVLALMALSAGASAASCPIAGDRYAWTTDYCLALIESDDESLAGPCLDQELQRRFVTACEGVSYYKQGLCGLAVQRGSYPGRAEDCMADAGFAGPQVRRQLAAAADAADPAPPVGADAEPPR